MTRRGLILALCATALLATLAVGLGATGDALGGGGHRSPCARTGSKTLLENSQARVYATRPGGRIKYACLKANDRRIKLDISLGGRRYYPPPAMDLAGPLLLAVIDSFIDIDVGGERASIRVHDLREDTGALSRSPVPTVNQGDIYQISGAGSAVLQANGSFAFIKCPMSLVRGVPLPACRRTGKVQTPYEVVKYERRAPAREVVLDRGRLIDPSSLRLSGSRLTWRNGTTTRRGTLK